MPLEIRLADNRDIPEVVRVIRAVYDEYSFTWDEKDYHADLYDLEGYYIAKHWPFYIALHEGKAVGTAALGIHETVPGENAALYEGVVRVGGSDCSLERLYVHPDARRMGAGGALLQRVIEEARLRGCKRMELWSDKRFEDAHRLYQKLGAKVVGERICHDPDQSPEWGLSIDLQ